MKYIENKASSTRVLFAVAEGVELTLELPPGVTPVEDELWEVFRERADRMLVIREVPSPSFGEEWNGGDLPASTTTLTEVSAIRAIVVFMPPMTVDQRPDLSWLEGCRYDDPRTAVKRAENSITHLKLSRAGGLPAV